MRKSLKRRRVGRHRRVKIEAVLKFRDKRDKARRKSLDELAQLGEDAGGYRELD